MRTEECFGGIYTTGKWMTCQGRVLHTRVSFSPGARDDYFTQFLETLMLGRESHIYLEFGTRKKIYSFGAFMVQNSPSLRTLGLCSLHLFQLCQFSTWKRDGKNLSNLVQVPELKWWIWASDFYLLISRKYSLKQSLTFGKTLLFKLQLTMPPTLLFDHW